MKEEATATCFDPTKLSVERVAVATLPTEWGEFQIAGYRSLISDEEFVVLYKGELSRDVPTLVRIHSQCLTVMYSGRQSVIVVLSSTTLCK